MAKESNRKLVFAIKGRMYLNWIRNNYKTSSIKKIKKYVQWYDTERIQKDLGYLSSNDYKSIFYTQCLSVSRITAFISFSGVIPKTSMVSFGSR
ncbi:IS3 family transposase [Erysipelothrix tonsillarum]|uniref:IS3 family transposase n=1 Tax=Erysipelothrix tonsillarum TaxID=38402 RepID=UPI0039C7B4F7